MTLIIVEAGGRPHQQSRPRCMRNHQSIKTIRICSSPWDPVISPTAAALGVATTTRAMHPPQKALEDGDSR
jgi:hypothetical protein